MDDNNQNLVENQTKTLYEDAKNYDPLKAEDLSPTTKHPIFGSGGFDSKKKYLIIGAAILSFIILFVIVFNLFVGRSDSSKELKLTYWGLWEENEVIEPLIAQYQATNPNIQIEYVKMTPEDYRNKLLVRSEQGQGPDIYRYHNTWIPEIKAVLSPLPENIISTSEFEKTFYPMYQNDLKVGDYYYGVPLMLDGLILLYNESLYKSAGISTPPKTWEDIINNISELTVRSAEGNIVTSGIAIGTASNIEHFSDLLGLFFLQNGADINNLDTAEAAGALESYRRFAEPPNNYWDETMPSAIQAFVQEKVAMIIVPSWQIPSIKTLNPELSFKAVPVPTLPGGEPVSVASYWVEGVSRYSEGDKQVAAWKFLKYLSEKDTMTKLYELQTNSRQYPSASSRVDLGTIQSQNEYLDAVIKQANYYKSISSIMFTYDNGLNDEINQYLANAINSTINGESYSSALKTANEGIAQVLNRYKNE